ncbi:protein tyrosine phosphatase-like domain-containing protein [Aspergillus glaucus CBS 516.65]|uniref:Very-long-chain (3R)-3-hydroxyacyl-CoA dehydratase n=1 Tax=Aspergillus glaucus CBS 516.65 TaxID=1160497 RepID=A0A1L9VYT9_ASPGL|nr:hypothetical protein ASPGLDRAFT_115635 [Aspergillus glaucus CBS 516.65]OJJ89086.1 hypothetical protein ASPGLDRAFT_115635 [Aspergillus glaucus CBS 516.65]
MSLTRLYLFTYNALAFTLWATSTTYAVLLLTQQTPLPTIFNKIYNPYLLTAQSLAILEILHSLLGLVRAPVMTTLMQVASRLLLVWGIMYPFGDHSAAWSGSKIVGGVGEAQLGDYAFLGCLGAWGVTECIRYGFFALQVGGVGVPGWWTWLSRYNTFYVLYPLGISSECTMVVKALKPAAEFHPAFWWFLVVVLGIYVPGSYILYTHMIAQRRKVLKKQKN